jgi:high-affinity Fe2+/Pb2+ permease
MARARNTDGDLDAIASERAKLQQRMAELDAAEKAAREAQRDAGRGVFLAALDKVKIGAMDRAQARGLAAAIGKHDAAELLRRIGDA